MADSTAAAGSTVSQEEVGSSVERNSVLWLTNASHAVNHFQNSMLAVLYVVIMPELGFGYAELGVLIAIRSVLTGATQGLYGFATPFVRRTWLLGIGNIVLGLGTLMTGFVNSFGGFLGTRAVASLGSSAQLPVGSSLRAGYFPRRLGTILALNTSISNIGSLAAPLTAAGLLLIMGWRPIFMIVASLSIAMGIAYFVFRRPEASGRGNGRPAGPSSLRARTPTGGCSATGT